MIDRTASASLVLLLLTGCASGKALQDKPTLDGAAAANAVVLCRTTLAELEGRLGPPSRDGLIHADRIVSWITEWDPLVRYLAVRLDKQGVVTDLYWNVPSEMPWVPTDQCD